MLKLLIVILILLFCPIWLIMFAGYLGMLVGIGIIITAAVYTVYWLITSESGKKIRTWCVLHPKPVIAVGIAICISVFVWQNGGRIVRQITGGIASGDFSKAIEAGDYIEAYKIANDREQTVPDASDNYEFEMMRNLAANASDGKIRQFHQEYNHVDEWAFGITDGGELLSLGADFDGESALPSMGEVVDFSYNDSVSDGPLLAAVRTDGTVSVAGSGANGSMESEISLWNNIIQVMVTEPYTNEFEIYGLTSDGTVKICSPDHNIDPVDCQDVKSLYRVGDEILALRNNGQVYSTSVLIDTDEWQDINWLYVEDGVILGVRTDGGINVFDASDYTNNLSVESVAEIESWHDIKSFTVNHYLDYENTVYGLKNDGTVVSSHGDPPEWTEMWVITTNDGYSFAGLKNDGTFVTTR